MFTLLLLWFISLSHSCWERTRKAGISSARHLQSHKIWLAYLVITWLLPSAESPLDTWCSNNSSLQQSSSRPSSFSGCLLFPFPTQPTGRMSSLCLSIYPQSSPNSRPSSRNSSTFLFEGRGEGGFYRIGQGKHYLPQKSNASSRLHSPILHLLPKSLTTYVPFSSVLF